MPFKLLLHTLLYNNRYYKKSDQNPQVSVALQTHNELNNKCN